MRAQRLAWSSLFVGVVLAHPSLARADPAAAEELFREARQLLERGQIDEACLKFAESQAQDPSSGTLLNLASCHEKQRKLATAWSEYISCGHLARDQGRVDRALVAEHKASELEPRLPHLTVEASLDMPGLQIFRGDLRLGPGLLGSAIPLDPGTYVISATAPGHAGWSATIEIAEAESKTLRVPQLAPDVPAAAGVGAPPPQGLGAMPKADPDHDAAPAPAARHPGPLGWTLGAAGITTIGVGAGFGLASLASYADATGSCPSHQNCSADALSARSRADWQAWVSDVAIGAGVVATAIGGYLLVAGVRAQPAMRVAIGCAPGLAGLGVSVERGF